MRDYGAESGFTIFLDGHYSSGITGHREIAVPIVKEFQSLRDFALENPGKNIAIIVDDVGLFMPGDDPSYPEKSTLLEFTASICADWTIENDMFVCVRPADAILDRIVHRSDSLDLRGATLRDKKKDQ